MDAKNDIRSGSNGSVDTLRLCEDRLKTILDLSTEWYWEQDENWRFTLIVGAGFGQTGIDPQGYLGTARWDHDAVPVGDDGSWDRHKAALEARQPFAGFVFRRVDPQGEMRYIDTSGQPVFEGGRFTGYRGIARDVTASMRAEQLLRLEHMVARCLAGADGASAALQAVIRAVCETQGWECGRYFSWNDKASVLRLDGFWHVPSAGLDHFIEKSHEISYAPGDGLVGQVFQAGQPLWVTDIGKDDRIRKGVARDAGMHGTFLFPVVSEGRSIGVLSFHSKRVREPEERLLQAVRMIGSQIGQFLQRKQAEEALRNSNERFNVAVRATNDIIWDWDLSKNEIWRNENFVKVFDYQSNEASTDIGFWRGLVHPEERERVASGIRTVIDSGSASWSDEYRFRRGDGGYAHVHDRGNVIRDSTGRALRMIGAMADITARKESDERIRYLATHDGLTTLPNRVMFSQLLSVAIQTARRYQRNFAVLFIDLDRFKTVNDTLGHEAGDKLLQEIATRLTGCLRASDVVARLGGDEFVVLVQEVNETEEVAMVARKILSAVLQPVVISGQECRVTGSIGICMYPDGGQDEQSLMKNADIAMYLAKEEGKNNFQFYSPNIKIESLERLTLETSLRRALERGEFFLHYQAKLEFKTNRITGVEALLRWQHPDLGMVGPTRFIPIAEETGLIVPIGRWVLQTACAQNVAWQREGLPPVCMAVNLSARQFVDENFLKDIIAALEGSGMNPELLELELTESMVMQNPERAAKLLAAIKRLGVRIAIDDFGVGYSSLAQIKRFPIDTLKVDRSFIRDLAENAEDRAITEAIIAMGKTLSLTVVAEGVETQEQQAFLSEHACDEMQGYYFSKPIAQDEFGNLLREHFALSQSD